MHHQCSMTQEWDRSAERGPNAASLTRTLVDKDLSDHKFPSHGAQLKNENQTVELFLYNKVGGFATMLFQGGHTISNTYAVNREQRHINIWPWGFTWWCAVPTLEQYRRVRLILVISSMEPRSSTGWKNSAYKIDSAQIRPMLYIKRVFLSSSPSRLYTMVGMKRCTRRMQRMEMDVTRKAAMK